MDEAVSFRLSTLQSTKDSVIRNRSTDRISPHSIKSKSQNLILSKIIHDNLPLIMNDIATNKHLKSLSICTNTLTISKLSYKHLLLVSAIITHQRWMY
jgi:type VI protein secretion system component Hcp